MVDMSSVEHTEFTSPLDEGVVARLISGVSLIVFCSRKIIEGNDFKSAEMAGQFDVLKKSIANIKFLRLRSLNTSDPIAGLKEFEKISGHIETQHPCILFVDDPKSYFLDSACSSLDGMPTIRRVLLADKYLARVFHDAIQIDLENQALSNPSRHLVPLTPIEISLLEEMDRRGMQFDTQVRLNPFVVDFIVNANGSRVVVEADGKEFHDSDFDALRDRRIKSEYGLDTLRFSGSEIFRNVGKCVDRIQHVMTGMVNNPSAYPDEGLAQLDPSQKFAVLHTGRDARVLAPAGSGKTKVLVNRTVHLLNSAVNAASILVLAFNKKAASQLEKRLLDLGIPVGKGGAENHGIWVATLNSFGFKLIRSEGSESQLLDSPWKEKALVERALKATGHKFVAMRGEDPVATITREIARIKRGLINPKGVSIEVQQPKGVAKVDQNLIWESVRDEQVRDRVITFDDQIFLAADLLLKEPTIRRDWQSRFTNVLVDEYQDLNPAQILLIQILTAGSASVFAVGDDDQVIYSWRDANVVNLLENFEDSYPGMTTYTLEINYRCPKPIVRSSQRLIKRNKHRHPKNIKPFVMAPEGKIELTSAEGLINLGKALTDYLVRRKLTHSEDWRDMAVLTRTKVQLLAAALALDKANIPRTALPQVRLFSTAAAKRLAAYLSIACTSDFDLLGEDIAHVVNSPNRFVRNEDVERLRTHHNPWILLNIFAYGCPKTRKPNGELKNLIREIEEIREIVRKEGAKAADVVDAILNRFKIAISTDQAAHSADDATDEIILYLTREVSRNFNDAREFLEYVRSEAANELSENEKAKDVSVQEETEDGRDRVTLSTIHGAKGREWRTVCMFDSSMTSVSLNQSQEIDIEEERRIFYVGMTRAMQGLCIFYASGMPNPFIGEALLPAELIGKEENDAATWLSVEKAKMLATEKLFTEQGLLIKNLDVDISELLSGQKTYQLRKQKIDRENDRNKFQMHVFELSRCKPDGLFHRFLKGGKSSKDISREMSILDLQVISLDGQIKDIESQIVRLQETREALIAKAYKEKNQATVQLDQLREKLADITGEIDDVSLAKDHMPLG